MRYICLTLLLLGCETSVAPVQFEAALKVCEPFGGLKVYDVDMNRAYCRDGRVVFRAYRPVKE